MKNYEEVKECLREEPRSWLVTGAAGFIGSNLVETLLRLGQKVVGLDNFSTGKRANLSEVRSAVGEVAWRKLRFIEGDIRSLDTCRAACRSVDFVLHQAALGSVPRSIDDPIASHDTNVNGFLNMLIAARDANVDSFVYASSSACYGDHPALPKVEDKIGSPLSPYAVTKYVNELYADVFARCYGFGSCGLRYFNVFGPRQDPDGPYAAVIPKWIASMLRGETVHINGDGETARDFCYVENAVQANILAAVAEPHAVDHVYNVALNDRVSLVTLFGIIKELMLAHYPDLSPRLADMQPVYREFRRGDVRFSQADVTKAQRLLGYHPTVRAEQGLELAIDWYVSSLVREEASGAEADTAEACTREADGEAEAGVLAELVARIGGDSARAAT